MNNKNCLFIKALLCGGAIICQLSAMTASPILSRGKTVYTSSGNKTNLTDNKFGSSSFTISNNSWVAINIGAGPTQVFFNWNSSAQAYSNVMSPSKCPNNNPMPVDYTLQTSSNSTNGSDGTWATAATITGNLVEARGHLMPFTGASWVKMNITNGGGSLDEIEVFNASKGAQDVWFFPGTSISQMAYKSFPPAQNFADLIAAAHFGYNPAVIRGGIGCITTTDMVNNLSKYLSMAGNAHYWAIEQGTNDAWGGSGNTTTFVKNMQTIIDSCKGRGIQPVIARLLATNPSLAGWSVNAAFETAIDNLTTQNKLVAGPDLYSYFSTHTSELGGDGIHPNATGAASFARLWAEKMASQYTPQEIADGQSVKTSDRPARNFSVSLTKSKLEVRAGCAGTLQLFLTNGAMVKSMKIPSAGLYSLSSGSGLRIARFSSNDNYTEKIPVVFR
jgi:lysophospholipase L1-like esterase